MWLKKDDFRHFPEARCRVLNNLVGGRRGRGPRRLKRGTVHSGDSQDLRSWKSCSAQSCAFIIADEIRSKDIQDLIGHMRDTMRDAPGVGLAAPQIGESLQITVIEDKSEYQKGLTAEQLSERQRVPIDFHAIINPQIDLLVPPDVSFYEGCLSIPRLMAMVARSSSVRVTCLDERGEQRVIEAAGWYARILQHEIDHLRGRLYTDTCARTLTTIDNHQRNNPASIPIK